MSPVVAMPLRRRSLRRQGLRLLPGGLTAALGTCTLALGFVAWPRCPAKTPAVTVRSATQTLDVDEQSVKDDIGGHGLASVLEQQLYDQKVKEETRLVREQATRPWWKRSPLRLLDDLAGFVTYPARFLRLARITKEVAAERTKHFKTLKSKSEQLEEGQPKQGLRGNVQAFKEKMKDFLKTYLKSHVVARTPELEYREVLNVTMTVLLDSIAAEEPYPFEPFHQAIRGPEFDYYSWGNRFFRPLIKYRSSRVDGIDSAMKIRELLAQGENVVLICNHQTEADPQVLSLLLEMEGFEEIAEQTIFVAGHKVTTDPVAVPFSMGRNLLTIFSKKYLDAMDEEEREAKSNRNRQTVAEMQRLLNEGGNIFWVAPSGGRDRRNPDIGEFEPAKFDPQSVGLFNVMAKKAEKAGSKTHFFPLAMWTHRLVPPPDDTKKQVGEERSARRAAVGIAFGDEVDPEKVGGRKVFPGIIEKQVNDHYWALHEKMSHRK